MVAINSVNIPFKGEDRRESGGIGVGVPLLGAGVGVGVNAIMNKGFSTLPAVDQFEKEGQDKFIKAAESLSGEDKTAAATVTDYFTKLNADKAKSGETSGQKSAETPTEPAKVEPAKVEPAKVEPAKAEVAAAKPEAVGVTPEQYMKKYGYGTDIKSLSAKEQALKDSIPKTEKELSEAAQQAEYVDQYTGNKAAAENLNKDIADIKAEAEQATSNAEKQAEARKAQLDPKKDAKEIASIDKETKAEILKIKEQEAKDLNPKYKTLTKLNEEAKKLEDQIRLTDAKNNACPAQFTPNKKKIDQAISDQGYAAGGTEETRLTKEALEKHIDEHFAQLEKEHPGKVYNATQRSNIIADIKADRKVKIKIRNSVQAQITEAQERIKAEEILKQKEAHFVNINELAKGKVTTIDTQLAGQKAKLAEMSADSVLISNAQAKGVKITPDGKLVEAPKAPLAPVAAEAPKPVAAEVPKAPAAAADAPKTTTTDAADTAKKAAEDLKKGAQEAFDKIKGKLGEDFIKEFKKFNWKGLGIGAGIGLVAGIAAKLIFGGKSEEA